MPALNVGLVIRIVLTIHLPYGFFHDDAPDFLTTPEKLLFEHTFELHGKKTFLVPILFTLPFLLHVPALIAIPLGQHLLGLVQIALIGGLTRIWFARWKLFIIPLTLIAAVNPFFLWYEHTLMAESVFVFCTVLLALAGSLYALDPTRNRFLFLCGALVLEAGARPEGKLLFGFGLFLLLLVHWRLGELRLSRAEFRASGWPRFLILFVLAVAMHFLTKTSQAGLLLYTSVVRFTPTEMKVAPGFDKYIAPVRESLQQRWDQHPSFPKVRDRREVSDAVRKYLDDTDSHVKRHRGVNEFCLKLAIETCKRNFFRLPIHAYYKFRAVSNESPAGLFDDDWLFRKQRDAIAGSEERSVRLARGLTGHTLTSSQEIIDFMHGHYGSVPWFNALSNTWLAALDYFRFPDLHYTEENGVPMVFPGVPFYFLIAAVGLVVAMFRRGAIQPFHIAWGLALLAFFYTIMLTANVRPRFRFVFEPFWYLYIAFLLDFALVAFSTLLARSTVETAKPLPQS